MTWDIEIYENGQLATHGTVDRNGSIYSGHSWGTDYNESIVIWGRIEDAISDGCEALHLNGKKYSWKIAAFA